MSSKTLASVKQHNRLESLRLNGQDLDLFLQENDQEVLEKVWMSNENMSVTHQRTYRRLRQDDCGRLRCAVQEVLQYRGLQCVAGNWEPILTMRCREVRLS